MRATYSRMLVVVTVVLAVAGCLGVVCVSQAVAPNGG
jgi:hypothetical protein